MEIERTILVGPDWVARAASNATNDPQQKWMLRQPRAVRRSYAAECFGRPDEERRAEAWMLLQPDAVRRSYVEQVLSVPLPAGSPTEPPERPSSRRTG